MLSFTNKTDCHDITELLLKVLNTTNQPFIEQQRGILCKSFIPSKLFTLIFSAKKSLFMKEKMKKSNLSLAFVVGIKWVHYLP